MSFDIFLQCYGTMKESGLSRDKVRALFPVVREELDPAVWVVQYDDLNGCDIHVCPDGSPLSDFMVSRPCGDLRLWAAMLNVLQMGSVVMFWPGSRPMVASGGSAEELPYEMREALGEPVFISQAEEFLELLNTT